jgi:hypothetical protein
VRDYDRPYQPGLLLRPEMIDKYGLATEMEVTRVLDFVSTRLGGLDVARVVAEEAPVHARMAEMLAEVEGFARHREALQQYSIYCSEGNMRGQMDTFSRFVSALWPPEFGRDRILAVLAPELEWRTLMEWAGYREHVLHQFTTFLLGSLVLHESAVAISGTGLPLPGNTDLADWMIASGGHDIARPIQAAGRIQSKLARAYAGLGAQRNSSDRDQSTDYGQHELEHISFVLDDHTFLTVNVISLFKNLMCPLLVRPDVLQDRWEKREHDVLGAALLLYLATSAIEHASGWEALLASDRWRRLSDALTAVALHHMPSADFTDRLRLIDRPLLYGLRLVDELEEWHRDWPWHDRFIALGDLEISTTGEDRHMVLSLSIGHPPLSDPAREKLHKWWEDKRQKLHHLGESCVGGARHAFSVTLRLCRGNSRILDDIEVAVISPV